MNNKVCFYMPPFPRIKSYYDMIDCAVEHNLSSVEGFCNMDFELPDKEAALKIKEYADSKNIIFPCFSVYINLVGNDSEEMKERLKGYADIAAILGSPYLHHTIANDFSNPDNVLPYKEEFFEKGVKTVREIYDYAESLGVKAIYEEQGYLFNGVENFSRFLDTVKRDVGVVADFANIYQAGEDIKDFINAFSDKFVHAHIKNVTLTESNEIGTGLKTLSGKYMHESEIDKGCANCKEVIDMLKKANYNGYYGLEFSAKSDESGVISDSLALIDSWL